MNSKIIYFLLLGINILAFSVQLSVSEDQDEYDVNVVELSYLEGAASDVEGVTEESPFTTTTEAFLPEHPQLKSSDKFSVPQPKGSEKKFGNLTIYESPYKNGSKALLITIYDIFGFHPHVKYIADELGEFGFRVIIPDFFHGKPVELENFPQPGFPKTAVHLFNKNGSWADIKPELLKIIKLYKMEEGITSVGIYGFCWGAKMAVYSVSDPEFENINAIGLVHPSRVTTEEASDIKAPAILLPSNSEPDMIPFLNILNRNIKPASEHYRFEDMTHGFAGARSDFSDKTIRQRVEEVVDRLSKFFIKVLKNSV